jgi:hypothetical protein
LLIQHPSPRGLGSYDDRKTRGCAKRITGQSARGRGADSKPITVPQLFLFDVQTGLRLG